MKNPIETAPRNGTPIRLFGQWTPKDGLVCWYGDNGWFSVAKDGRRVLAAYDFTGWEPIRSGEFIPFALPDEQLRALTS